MCGELKFNCDQYCKANIGDPIPYNGGVATWDGFAKSEKIDWWIQQGKAQIVNIPAKSFNESGYDFQVNGTLKGLLLKKDVYISREIIGRAETIKILTRQPISKVERKIHSRWPIIVKKT